MLNSSVVVEERPVPRVAEPNGRSTQAITWRVVVISLVLAVVFGVVLPTNDYRFSNTYLGASQLPVGSVGVLLLLLLCQVGLRRFASRFAFSRNEALTIYLASVFSCLAPSRASATLFVNIIIAPFYYATQENGWLKFLQPYVRPWMTPALNGHGELNAGVADGWYLGNGQVPWGVWFVPLLAWSVLILALYAMFVCLASMLRAQWATNEVLSFPLLRLPLELTEGMDAPRNSEQSVGTLFRNPLLWIGAGLVVLAQTMSGLHLYFPDVPSFPLSLNLLPLFSEAPWNQVGGVQTRIMPLVVGISYLLNTEISLSVWFFYVLHKAEYVVAYYLGYMPSALPDPIWTRGFSKGFISYQSIGAYFAYAGVLFWTGRRHYGYIVRRALGRERGRRDEKDEALSYPTAFWGFVGCCCFLLGWTIAAGVHPLVALMMWGTYLAIIICLTRIVAEAGLTLINHGWSPLLPFANLFGGGTGTLISPSSAVPAAMIQTSLMIDLKGLLLPCFLQSFKLAYERKIPLRPLIALLFGVTVISSVVGMVTIIKLGYKYGGLGFDSWFARDSSNEFINTASALNKGVQPDLTTNGFWFGVGVTTVLLLIKLRAQFTWFPLHPVGYLMWAPYSASVTWFSFFLGWLLKTQITRFGGHDTYRRLTPFFLGLILGDVGMMLFWLVIDTWQGRTFHNLLG